VDTFWPQAVIASDIKSNHVCLGRKFIYLGLIVDMKNKRHQRLFVSEKPIYSIKEGLRFLGTTRREPTGEVLKS
jgi:hypothetical protein